MTRFRFATVALALSALPCVATAQEASTIRIEPRPFYGATVTLEEGVRVFRPLPVHKQVIINPGNRTPLNLGLYDERNYNYNYNYNLAQPAVGGSSWGGVGFADGFSRKHHRHHHHQRLGRRTP